MLAAFDCTLSTDLSLLLGNDGLIRYQWYKTDHDAGMPKTDAFHVR
jgi:hypothetical protein